MASPVVIGRRYERKVTTKPLTLIGDFGGAWGVQSAVAVDFSRGGLRIQTSAELTLGQIIEVVTLETDQSYAKPGRVVWAGATKSGQEHEAGLQFLVPSPRPLRW